MGWWNGVAGRRRVYASAAVSTGAGMLRSASGSTSLGKKIMMWPTVAVIKHCDVPTYCNTTTCHSIIMFRQCHMCDTAKWHCNCDFCSSIMTMQVVMQDSCEQNIIMSTGVPVIASCDGGVPIVM